MSRRPTTSLAALPIHPYLFAAAIVLSPALATSVDVHAVVRPFLVSIGIAALLHIALSAAMRSRHAGALATTLLLGLLSAGVVWVVGHAVVTTAAPWQVAVLLVLLTGTLLLAGRILRRAARKWTWPQVSRGLNVLSAALLAVVLGSAVLNGNAAHALSDLRIGGAIAPDEASSDPDIVVILLDGYPRSDTLQRIFDLDNSAFLGELERLGFDVAEGSRSNYTATHLTFMSMFHMTHLTDIPGYQDVIDGVVAPDPRVRNLINDNPVLDQLSEWGYTTISVVPGIERVTLRSVDTLYDSMQLNEFEYHLLRSSAVGGLWSTLDPAFMARQHRDRVVDAMHRVEDLAREPLGGRFIFAHILKPHMPAVFHRDGSLRPVPYSDAFYQDDPTTLGMPMEEFISSYRDQLLAINDRVIGMVETIVRENSDATVIVMSDHGSATHFDSTDRDSDLDERFATLFAARTPGHGDVFTDWQTPVNVFPRLFNTYFGTSLPIRTDATYVGVRKLVRVENPDADAGATRSGPMAAAASVAPGRQPAIH